jgi:hypothetical protein
VALHLEPPCAPAGPEPPSALLKKAGGVERPVLERPAPALLPLVERVHSRLRPGRVLEPAPRVSFYPYAGGGSTVREREGHLHFRLSDRLQGAPDAVLEGVVGVLLCRCLGLPDARADPAAVRAYRAYLNDERNQGSLGPAPAGRRGRKHIDPVGSHRSLLESYLRVTLDMGLALPRVPTLSWSKTVSRHRFGHWDPEHNAVVISQVLDDPAVPEFVLDYVVYHELLHILHPVKMGSATKRIVHSAAFRRDERRFPRWKEGEEWIRRLARRKGR